jgi:hypothetical protein
VGPFQWPKIVGSSCLDIFFTNSLRSLTYDVCMTLLSPLYSDLGLQNKDR